MLTYLYSNLAQVMVCVNLEGEYQNHVAQQDIVYEHRAADLVVHLAVESFVQAQRNYHPQSVFQRHIFADGQLKMLRLLQPHSSCSRLPDVDKWQYSGA